jgi:hypothetical protein
MIKKSIVSVIVLLVLVAAAAAAYLYYAPAPVSLPTTIVEQLPPAATPDNSVIAGPVTAVSASSITVKKQDGTSVSLTLATSTQIVMAGDNGQAGTVKKAGDIKLGVMVLVTPSKSDASVALSVVLLPAPPTL